MVSMNLLKNSNVRFLPCKSNEGQFPAVYFRCLFPYVESAGKNPLSVKNCKADKPPGFLPDSPNLAVSGHPLNARLPDGKLLSVFLVSLSKTA